MAGKRISELVEVLSVDVEQDYIAIQRGTDNKKLKLANMMGSTNVGEDFVDLLGEDGIEYRLLIDSAGKVQVFPKDCVVGHVYEPGDRFCNSPYSKEDFKNRIVAAIVVKNYECTRTVFIGDSLEMIEDEFKVIKSKIH